MLKRTPVSSILYTFSASIPKLASSLLISKKLSASCHVSEKNKKSHQFNTLRSNEYIFMLSERLSKSFSNTT